MLHSSWHAAPSSPDDPLLSWPPLQHVGHHGRAAWSQHGRMLTGGGPAPRLQMGTRRSRRPARLDPVLSTTAVSHTCLPWMHATEPADFVPPRSRTASLPGCSPSGVVLLWWPQTELRVRSARRFDALWRCIGADHIHAEHVGAWHVMRKCSACMGSSNVNAVNCVVFWV